MASLLNADNGSVSGSAGLKSTADSSGVLALQTNGTTAVTVDTSQNVGIGTASPAYKLDVAGTIKTSGTGYNGVSSASVFLTNTTASTGRTFILNSYNSGGFQIADETAGGLTRFYINSSGNSIFDKNIGIGATVPTTSGTGITFPATQSASTDANTLDDYEEGTWTPTASNFTISGASTLTGAYTKIGRVVYFNVSFANTGTIGYSASALITLPFTGIDLSGMVAMYLSSSSESQTSGKSGVQIYLDTANGRFFPGNFTTTSSGQTLIFAGFYRVS